MKARWPRAAVTATMLVLAALFLAACGSETADSTLVVPDASAPQPPTAVATTPPLSVPTLTPTPTLFVPPATPIPVPTSTPTSAPSPVPTPSLEPLPTTGGAGGDTNATPVSPSPASAPEIVETPTPPVPPTVEPFETEVATAEPLPTSTPVSEAPTAVASNGGRPIECYDPEINLDRGFVEGVDGLTIVGGRVTCVGAGTNAVSAPRSYRHSTGLVVTRNADNQFDPSGTGYIRYSGTFHFCVEGQPTTAPFVADTLYGVLIVIDNEARVHVAQGAVGPASFTTSGAQC